MKAITNIAISLGIIGNLCSPFNASGSEKKELEFRLLERYEAQEISQNSMRKTNSTICIDEELRKDLNTKYQKRVRVYIQEKAKKKHNVFIFGDTLDLIIEDIKTKAEKEQDYSKSSCIQYELNIPENFKTREMDLEIYLDRSDKKLRIYQFYEGDRILLAERPVAIGKLGMPIILGNYFITRVIENPRWYGYSNKSKNPKVMPKPGPKSPFGIRMSELSTIETAGTYENLLDYQPRFPIRWHLTDKPESVGKASSSGCFRSHPDTDVELFDAILFYTPSREGIQTHRGKIYPLDKAIPFNIQE